MRRIHCALILLPACLALWGCPPPDPVRSIADSPDGQPGTLIAQGYTPGWSLEMSIKVYRFESGELGLLRSGKTPVGTVKDGRAVGGHYRMEDMEVHVAPADGGCLDSESKQRLYWDVTVTLDDRQLQGCAGSVLPPEDLDGTSWLGNKKVHDVIARDFGGTLQFRDGIITGSTGCNRFSGSYSVSGGKLTTGPLAMTRMACPGLADHFEREFVAMMSAPVNIRIMPNGDLALSRYKDDPDARDPFYGFNYRRSE